MSSQALIAVLAAFALSLVHGDPYRWLEADVSDPLRQQWLDEQEQKTLAWWQQQDAQTLQDWQQRLQRLWSQPRLQLPQPRPGFDYFFFNPGLDDQYSFYRLPTGDNAAPSHYCAELPDCGLPRDAELLLTASWFDQGALLQVQISKDQQYLAYAVGQAETGVADWYLAPVNAAAGPAADTMIARDVRSLVWSTAADREALHFLHAGDNVVRQRWLDEGQLAPAATLQSLPSGVTDAELVAAVSSGSLLRSRSAQGSALWLLDRDGGWVQLLDSAAEWLDFVTESAEGVWFLDYREDEFGAVSRLQLSASAAPQWQQLIPSRGKRLQQLAVSSRGLIISYQQAAVASLYFLARDDFSQALAGLEAVSIPLGEHSAVSLAAGVHTARIQVVLSALNHAPSLWQLQAQSVAPDLHLHLRWLAPQAQAQDYSVMLQPVSIAAQQPALLLLAGPATVLHDWQQGSALQPQALLLETYSGFDLPLQLDYSLTRRAWIEAGGLYARLAVRGSGDHDALWHWQGSGRQRQSSIDDVLAVVAALQSGDLTAADRLAVMGISHGATLMAAAVAQAPQAFAALVAVAGVMDLLRFAESGAGASWRAEYGDPALASNAAVLQRWSPYHHVLRSGGSMHPPVMLVSNRDDSVVRPWHSLKYHAALTAATEARQPQLLHLLPGSAHAENLQVQALIEDYARRWYFLQQLTSP